MNSVFYLSRFGEVIPQFLDIKNRWDLTDKTQPLGVALRRYTIGDSLALFTSQSDKWRRLHTLNKYPYNGKIEKK